MEKPTTKEQINFVKELKELLTKHNVEIESFEGEMKLVFNECSLWLDDWHITKDTL